MLNFNLSEWAITNRPVVWFMLIVVVITGAWSYLGLGRNEDPPFTVKAMVVQAQWPGATMEDTLQQVTERIEKKLQETPYLDFVRSYTTPGKATVFVILKDSTPPKLVSGIWYLVRKKIDDIRYTFPQGVLGPVSDDEFGDTYAIIYAFTADGFTHRELRDYVESVRSRLLRVTDVSKIDVFGAQDERLYLEFSFQRLAGIGLDRRAVISALQSQNAVTPAGVIVTEHENILLRVSGGFTSEQDLARVNIAAGGRLFRLVDLGTLKRAYADPPQPLFRFNGQNAVALGISMREGGDVLALGYSIERTINEITADLPLGIEPHLVADQPKVVHHAVGEFMEALGEAIAIVMAVSFLSLGIRAGSVVALSIPLVLAAVFVTMSIAEISLQRVSLGALIVALGLLVDDAMITVEAMVARMEQGWEKAKAAVYAYATTHFPMGTGTLVTVAAFLPIGMARSAAGEYTFSLFAVVAIALIVSWFVAAIFTPLFGMVLLKDKVEHASTEPGRVMRSFQTILLFAMRRRWATLVVTLTLLAMSLVGLLFVPQQLFPASDRPELMLDLRLRQNASIYATDQIARRFDEVLRRNADIEHWSTYVGRGAVRFYLPLDVQLTNDFFAQMVIVTKSPEARERVRAHIEQTLLESFPELVGRVYPLEMGPPVGWPLQYRVSGPDPARVRDIGYQIAEVMAEHPAVHQLNFDWMEPAKTLKINVDQDQARLLGVSSEALAQSLNSVVSGVTATRIRDGIYLIDLISRASEDERVSLSSLRTLPIQLPDGRTVPLIQVASVSYTQEIPLIWRRDRLPTLTVQSDVAPGTQPMSVVQALRSKIGAVTANLPPGYAVAIGGSPDETVKSQLSLVAALPTMLLLILGILMAQLHSFQRLFLVLSVAPLGLIGVVAALLVSGKPLGFIALLGVIALIGMIVRNSVILILQIDAEINQSQAPWDGIVKATMNRFRPILLTAAAAILGMIPIAPAVFWAPMAYTIMGGLLVATVLTLIFLPAFYAIWFRIKEPGEAKLAEATAP